jgi:hypothetical protein
MTAPDSRRWRHDGLRPISACLLSAVASAALFGLCPKSSIAQPTDAKGSSVQPSGSAAAIRVGAAAVDLAADDTMVIAGGIGPRRVTGQEGKLRAVAVVIEKPPEGRLAIVACDVLFTPRDLVDPALEEIEKTTGIPPARVLVNATHTHSAPSVTRVHGYDRDPAFAARLREGIVQAVRSANSNRVDSDPNLFFDLAEEATIGANSRQLLSDGMIYWVGPRDGFVRPTGPFDPQLPVLAFRTPQGRTQALIYNHSTHTIGTRKGNVRSPSFYGLAAQELEQELGGTVCFLEGASGSTHNLGNVSTDEAVRRLKLVVRAASERAQPRPLNRLASIKQRFTFKVRKFDEQVEEEKVVRYCRKYIPQGADSVIDVFRTMRRELAPLQGQQRETWLQTVLLGDIAIVGVPAEYFTSLGVEIKKRSPFRYTFVAELANDWIGYLPDREAHQLGGYQTWMGHHCYAEEGTGERVADEVIKMLRHLAEGS